MVLLWRKYNEKSKRSQVRPHPSLGKQKTFKGICHLRVQNSTLFGHQEDSNPCHQQQPVIVSKTSLSLLRLILYPFVCTPTLNKVKEDRLA